MVPYFQEDLPLNVAVVEIIKFNLACFFWLFFIILHVCWVGRYQHCRVCEISVTITLQWKLDMFESEESDMSDGSTFRSVVFCCGAGFQHLFYISIPVCPQLPVWVHHSHRHLPNRVAVEFFLPCCWFTSYSAFNNFMQKSILSQNMTNPFVSFVR